jgi:hypothetical protein
MTQLKCICFICNIFNCLNEKNKRFTNFFFSLSLFNFLFIFSYFLFILFEMYLINILMKKKKSSLYLIFFLSSLTLCLYLNVRQLNEENKSFSNYLFHLIYISLVLA